MLLQTDRSRPRLGTLALWAAVLSQALSDVRSAISYAKHGPPLSTRNGEEAAARHAVAWVFAPLNPDREFVLGLLGLHEDALYRELVRWHGRDLTHVLDGDAIDELDQKLSVPGGIASVEPRVRIVPSRWASARLEQAPRRPRGRPRRAAAEPGSRSASTASEGTCRLFDASSGLYPAAADDHGRR